MDAPEKLLPELQPLTDTLYVVFESAVVEAQNYLEAKTAQIRGGESADQRMDPYVFSQLVRFYASEVLDSRQYAGVGYFLERLPNCGILLNFAGRQIRVWKADEGQLPAPGNSRAKQDFYQQALFPDDVPRKLAVLWESYRSGQVVLILACPKGDGEPWESGQSHWEITIPHPAERAKTASAIASDADDFEDLRFKRRTGTGDNGNDD